MKSKNTRKDGKAGQSARLLVARAAELEGLVEVAKARARTAKIEFKQARKALKLAKRAAKQARKEAKAVLKAAKGKDKKAERGKKEAGPVTDKAPLAATPAAARRIPPVRSVPKASSGVVPVANGSPEAARAGKGAPTA
jgi:rubrerythrin